MKSENEQPKSTLREFLDEIVNEQREFIHTSLDEFKKTTLAFLERSKGTIREQDRRKMIFNVHQDQNLPHLQAYIFHSLLKFEGLGVVSLLPR